MPPIGWSLAPLNESGEFTKNHIAVLQNLKCMSHGFQFVYIKNHQVHVQQFCMLSMLMVGLSPQPL